MDLKALLLTQGFIVTTCLSTFVAARQLAPEALAWSSSASSLSSSLCSRALATTLWGSAFAFFSLMADAWPASKTFVSLTGDNSCLERLMYLLLFGPVVPLFGICTMLGNLFTALRFRQILRWPNKPELGADNISMSKKLLRRVIEDVRFIFGINQPKSFLKSTKIVANTYIVVGKSHLTTLPATLPFVIPATPFGYDGAPVNDACIADALTFGHRTTENLRLMQLNQAGKLALLESSILPNYKQLRFLEGRSGIATFIIGVQAIGYVISIVYRAIHHLPVSPIEAIGFAFSMFVVVHSLVHSVGVICNNPLVIYLNPTQEQEMLDKCESTRWSDVDDAICENAAIVGMVVVGSVVVAFMILVEWHVLRRSWLDAIGPILFLLSLVTQSFSTIIFFKYLGSESAICRIFLFPGCVFISFGGIVLSIVATILNWQTNQFDSPTPSVIHILPFLG